MNKRIKKQFRINHRNIIVEHIKANINIYFIILILFIVGMTIGVFIVNNLSESQSQNINKYVVKSIDSIKAGNKLPEQHYLKNSLKRNAFIVFFIWILGLTFFGKYLLYLVILLFGITLGYTTSSIMLNFNFGQSMLVFLSTMLLQNTIAIPTMFFLCVQGIKCHNNFSKNQSNYNIKYILIKFTIYSILSTLLLFISSLIETYISGQLIYLIIKYL